jgi:hypothetical protein
MFPSLLNTTIMKKLDKQVYLRDMDEITAERVALIKDYFHEKTSKKAVEKLIHHFFPLMEENEKIKRLNVDLLHKIESQQVELNTLLIKVRALLRNESDREEIVKSLNDTIDFSE